MAKSTDDLHKKSCTCTQCMMLDYAKVQLRAARKLVKSAVKYMVHGENCKLCMGGDRCTCGLAKWNKEAGLASG